MKKWLYEEKRLKKVRDLSSSHKIRSIELKLDLPLSKSLHSSLHQTIVHRQIIIF